MKDYSRNPDLVEALADIETLISKVASLQKDVDAWKIDIDVAVEEEQYVPGSFGVAVSASCGNRGLTNYLNSATLLYYAGDINDIVKQVADEIAAKMVGERLFSILQPLLEKAITNANNLNAKKAAL